MRFVVRALIAALTVAFGVTACGGGAANAPGFPWSRSMSKHGTGSGYIQHVVIVIQENRSFDDFFATFPGADGTTFGCMKPSSSLRVRQARRLHRQRLPERRSEVPLKKVQLAEPCDWGHSYQNAVIDYDGGKMDGFGEERAAKICPGKAGTKIFNTSIRAQIAAVLAIAQNYVLADQMFQTQGSGSFTAHQDLIAGATIFNQPKIPRALSTFRRTSPWGCDASSPERIRRCSLWNGTKIQDEYRQGTVPVHDLSDDARSARRQRRHMEVLLAAGEEQHRGSFWNAFDAIEAVREGPEWSH